MTNWWRVLAIVPLGRAAVLRLDLFDLVVRGPVRVEPDHVVRALVDAAARLDLRVEDAEVAVARADRLQNAGRPILVDVVLLR